MSYSKDELLDYQKQRSTNEDTFKRLLEKVRPDIYVLMDLIDKTSINTTILYYFLKHLHGICTGSRYGQVTATIENGVVTFVRGEESSRVNERVINPVERTR